MFAKFSPDGTRVAYVRQNNIYVERIDTGCDRAADEGRHGPASAKAPGRLRSTKAPAGQAPAAAWAPATAGTIVNGTSDWVNEEELDIRDGFRWSPDGPRHRLLAVRHGRRAGNFTLIDDTASLYPKTTVFAYPKPGTTNSAVRVGVVSAGGGVTTWIKTSGDPRNTYVASLEWIDASTVAMQQLNRLQTENDYLLARCLDRARHARVPRCRRRQAGRMGRRPERRALDGRRARVPVAQRARRLAAPLSVDARRRRRRC